MIVNNNSNDKTKRLVVKNRPKRTYSQTNQVMTPPPYNPANYAPKTNSNFPEHPEELTRKYSKKKNIVKGLLIPAIALSILIAPATVMHFNKMNLEDYNQSNQIFDVDKVDKYIDYYGGDSRYVDTASTSNIFANQELCTHFNPEHTGPINVVVSKEFSYNDIKQIKYAFDHINEIFEVINPRYKFNVTVSDNFKNSDIEITYDNIASNQVGARAYETKKNNNSSRITHAKISVNENMQLSDAYKRYIILHEMLHVLLGSEDVNERESETFSVYNYGDVAFMQNQINKALIIGSDDIPKYTTLPVMTREEQRSFVSYTPVDVSTLIAVYGDSSSKENRNKYLELLQKVYADNCKVFKDYQPYYVDGFELPKPEKSNNDNGFEQ